MTEEIKAGDWVVSKIGCESFRVAGFGNSLVLGPMIVDKWGFGRKADAYRKYKGATSPLEAIEAAQDDWWKACGGDV